MPAISETFHAPHHNHHSLECCVLSCFSHVQFFATLWTVCSLPGASIHGILQAGILEEVAMLSSRFFPTQGSNPCFWHLLHWQAGSLPLAPARKPLPPTIINYYPDFHSNHFAFLSILSPKYASPRKFLKIEILNLFQSLGPFPIPVISIFLSRNP